MTVPAKPRPSRDRAWLERVRSDLESKPETWAVKPDQHGDVSHAQAIGSYLDKLLTDLGVPPTPHTCPTCGRIHRVAS